MAPHLWPALLLALLASTCVVQGLSISSGGYTNCVSLSRYVTLTPSEYSEGTYLALSLEVAGGSPSTSSTGLGELFSSSSLQSSVTWTLDEALTPQNGGYDATVKIGITDADGYVITTSGASYRSLFVGNVHIECNALPATTTAEETSTMEATPTPTSTPTSSRSTSAAKSSSTVSGQGGGGGGNTYVDQGCLVSCKGSCPSSSGCPNGDDYGSCVVQRQDAKRSCENSCDRRCTKTVIPTTNDAPRAARPRTVATAMVAALSIAAVAVGQQLRSWAA